jgi:putative addiction module CopG family antidote
MTIHLPAELERFVHDQVLAGRYRSEDDVIREALEQLRLRTASATASRTSVPDPVLGSMRDDAELMDEIVADAYRHRREETWREIEL